MYKPKPATSGAKVDLLEICRGSEGPQRPNPQPPANKGLDKKLPQFSRQN